MGKSEKIRAIISVFMGMDYSTLDKFEYYYASEYFCTTLQDIVNIEYEKLESESLDDMPSQYHDRVLAYHDQILEDWLG